MNLDLAPNKVTEQRALINTIRDEMERLPIEVTFSLGTFDVDCDEKADLRMSNALMSWSALPGSTIDWVLADNTSLNMTETVFQEFYDEVVTARAVRSLHLHAFTLTLKASLPVSDDDDMFDGSTWLIL